MRSQLAFVSLDPALRRADPAKFDALFAGFATGYAKHFSGDQAEATTEWPARIDGTRQSQPVMRIVVAVESVDGRDRIVGGVAAEYYRRARCMLATYLYMTDDNGHRRRGHARTLLAKAREACENVGTVAAVVMEAEWPEALELRAMPASEVATARERLRFFARLGVRLITIDYVQPALGGDKQPVSYLRLFLLPSHAEASVGSDEDLAGTVEAFLEEFYAALAEGRGAVADRAGLDDLKRQLRERRPLTMPLPRLRLGDVALSFHFVEPLDGRPDGADIVKELASYQCPVLHSMETDLLSGAYRTRRLFRTVCLTKPMPSAPAGADAGIAVEIRFPARLRFSSENRLERRQWPLRRRTVRAYLAPTVFFSARQIVWHLVLRIDSGSFPTDPHRWFDEVDLITLLKLADAEADQEFLRVPDDGDWRGPSVETAEDRERRSIRRGIEFRVLDDDKGPCDVKGLLDHLAAIAYERLAGHAFRPHNATPLCGATVELLGRDTQASEAFYGISDGLEREALCGIINGILDFDQIDDAEASDTLTSSVPLDTALLSVQRETLVYVGRDDRAARTVAGSVGISPYLIIPHATALCNEALLMRDPSPVGHLSEDVQRLEDALRTRWVPDPFFYPTERRLYGAALDARGTTALREKAEEELREMKTRVELAREAERARFEALVTGLLGAISVVSVDAFVIDFVLWLYGSATSAAAAQGKAVGHLLTLGLACFIGLVIYATKRPETERAQSPTQEKGTP